MFIAALLTKAKTWKQPKCPSTKMWCVCVYIYIYMNTIILGHKQE